jgi:hypothetical protein
MKRKILVITAIGLLAAAGLFADREFGPWNRGENNGCPGGGYFRYSDNNQTVTVSGIIRVEQDKIPVLRADGQVYVLMYPWFRANDLKLENGMRVTVEGYVNDSVITGDSNKVMHAVKITVGDKTYELPRGFPGGPRGGDDDNYFPRHRGHMRFGG